MSLSSFFILFLILSALLGLALLSLFFPSLSLCHMLCLFCLFLVLPIPLFSYCCELWLSSLPLHVGLTFHLFLILGFPFCFFYSLPHISLLYVFFSCLSWGQFSLFSPDQCFFVLCDFPFQHSSLFSSFFSAFPLLLTFEYFSLFMCLCLPPLALWSPLESLHILCISMVTCVCLWQRGFLTPSQ